jgi:hypothetical protein
MKDGAIYVVNGRTRGALTRRDYPSTIQRQKRTKVGTRATKRSSGIMGGRLAMAWLRG